MMNVVVKATKSIGMRIMNIHLQYRSVPKFSDRQLWANSADPDQTAQGLHCSPFHLHRLDSLLYGRAT